MAAVESGDTETLIEIVGVSVEAMAAVSETVIVVPPPDTPLTTTCVFAGEKTPMPIRYSPRICSGESGRYHIITDAICPV